MQHSVTLADDVVGLVDLPKLANLTGTENFEAADRLDISRCPLLVTLHPLASRAGGLFIRQEVRLVRPSGLLQIRSHGVWLGSRPRIRT